MLDIKPQENLSNDSNFMKIEAINTKITTLLKNSYYCIPRFQRKYVWSPKEVNDLLKDINENPINYFIGSLVLYIYQEADNERKDVKGIVDGQQRLTTILIVLKAIRDIFMTIAEKVADEELRKKIIASSNGTYNNYILKMDDDENTRHVVVSETSKIFLERVFDKDFLIETLSKEERDDLNQEEKALMASYITAKSFLENLIKGKTSENQYKVLYDFREKVLQLSIITVELIDLESAHIVFDSLNDRGKSIDAVDKTKSYLLRLLRKTTLDTDSPLHRWNKIQERLNANKESSIFLDYLESFVKSTRSKEISKDDLFNEIKKEIIGNDKQKAETFLEDLEENTNYFLTVYNQKMIFAVFNISDDHAKEINSSLEALKLYNIKVHTSFLMLAIREYKKQNLSSKNISNFLKKAVAFHFKYNVINSLAGNTIRVFYINLVRELLSVDGDKNQKLREFNFDKFKSSLSDKENFKNRFKEKIRFSERESANKRLVQHILKRIDMLFIKNTINFDYSSMTIEHLIPQSITTMDTEQIGNLVFMTRDMQNKLKNKPLKEKIQILQDQGYFDIYNDRLLIPQAANISDSIEDNIKLIEERTDKLIDKAFTDVWG